jgi:hypothetical protein
MKVKTTETKVVYQVWFETSIGPTFSTRHKAVKYLEDQYPDSLTEWIEREEATGYPVIVEIILDGISGVLMDR